jgi:hypothetical protein
MQLFLKIELIIRSNWKNSIEFKTEEEWNLYKKEINVSDDKHKVKYIKPEYTRHCPFNIR